MMEKTEANCFHALAGIYGEGAPLQRCPTPLPGTLLPRLIELVVALGLASTRPK